jgi:cobalt/nickel transport system permease protein
MGRPAIGNVLAGLLVLAALTGGILSWFASDRPDGLEWSMFHTSGKEKLEPAENGLHSLFARLQEKTAFLPDYGFMKAEQDTPGVHGALSAPEKKEPWPAVSAGTSVSGLVGGTLAMGLAGFIGFALKKRHRQR